MDSKNGFTVTFTGKEPELKSVFFPPIELNGDYVIGLVDFQSYNSIFNVRKPLNKLYYYEVKKAETPKGTVTIDALNVALKDKVKVLLKDKVPHIKLKVKVIYSKGIADKLNTITENTITINDGEDLYYYDHNDVKTIEIPEGSYEVHEIEKEVQKHLDVIISSNTRTMKATILSSVVFDFTKPSLGTHLLGFRGISTPDKPYESVNKVTINNINSIRVKCSIANGSYLNGKLSHTIHSFYPEAPPGYKIIEVPRNIIYFPVNKRTIDEITITFADQQDNPIDFNGEETTLTCHIKKL